MTWTLNINQAKRPQKTMLIHPSWLENLLVGLLPPSSTGSASTLPPQGIRDLWKAWRDVREDLCWMDSENVPFLEKWWFSRGPYLSIFCISLSLSLSLCIGLYAWREREGERESPRTCIEIHTCKQARKIRWQMIEMHFSGYIYI